MDFLLKISAMTSIKSADFNGPDQFKASLRRADDFTKLAVTVASIALNTASAEKTIAANRVGIFLGTGFGPLETSFRFLDTLLDDGEGNASPTIFSHSVHNAAAGYISRILKIYGPALTFTSFTWPFLTALEQAQIAIFMGTIDRAVVVGVEVNSPALNYTFAKLYPNQDKPEISTLTIDTTPLNESTAFISCHKKHENDYQGTKYNEADNSGAVVWILDRYCKDDESSKSIVLEKLEMIEKPCQISDLITRAGEKWTGSDLHADQNTGILSNAFSLTKQLENFDSIQDKNFVWTSTAPFGQARLRVLKLS